MDGPVGRPSNYLILTLCEAPQALSGQNSGFASVIKSGMTMSSPMRHDTVVTTPHGSKPGASGMTPVCRPTPTVRFMSMSEHSSKQLMHYMARFLNAVAFLPLVLCQGTRRNAIWFLTCIRTVSSLAQNRTHV